MEPEEKTLKNTHHGHAVKRIRNTLGIKQDALATDVGMSQTMISRYEQRKVIEDDVIEKIAKALKVSPEFIKEMEEDPVTIIIENNTVEKGGIIAQIAENNTTHNNPDPIDRIIELANEKTALYERMLELEKEKNTLLEKLLKERK